MPPIMTARTTPKALPSGQGHPHGDDRLPYRQHGAGQHKTRYSALGQRAAASWRTLGGCAIWPPAPPSGFPRSAWVPGSSARTSGATASRTPSSEAHGDRRAARLDLGVTLFDTAEIYGFGRSERILGPGSARSGVDIRRHEDHAGAAGRRRWSKQRGAASAKRLGARTTSTSTRSTGQPGRPRRDRSARHAARSSGKAWSPRSGSATTRCSAGRRPSGARRPGAVQPGQVQPGGPPTRTRLIPYAAQHDRVVIAYSPLGQGLLSGRYHEGNRPSNFIRALNPLFLPENLERSAGLIATLREDRRHALRHPRADSAGLVYTPPGGGRDPWRLQQWSS